jgi:GNAT superfamily N-acetyltransferase
MTDITIRTLTPDDWPAFRAIRLEVLADAPHAFGATVEQEAARSEQEWRERMARTAVFFAERDGRALGVIGVRPVDAAPPDIVSMWVRPGARGLGVGDLLIETALGWVARRHGPDTAVRLWVASGNEAAERLYLRHGFRRTGETDSFGTGGSREKYAMVRAAAAG